MNEDTDSIEALLRIIYCGQIIISFAVYYIQVKQLSMGLIYYLNAISILFQLGVYKFRERCQLLIVVFNVGKTIAIICTYTDNLNDGKLVMITGIAEFIINVLFLVSLLPQENINPNKIVPITYKNNNESCSICLEQFENNTTVNKTVCNHIYHAKCIDNWLLNHDTCPICRTIVVS